ncbi:MAG: delta-60 repeat domain-containing protein [Flavobacteriales bacterium]|nr:delta-60 repeat domain-containing protein [Flavobacteriales bacterium]
MQALVLKARQWHLALDDNGRVIVGGSFTDYGGVECKNLARIAPNGAYDASYVTGSGTNLPVVSHRIERRANLVGGSFVSYNDLRMRSILITLPDGSVDSTFNLGTGANDAPVQTIAVQTNGKILIGGGFAKYNGVRRNGIARLNPDGSLDENFATGLGTGIERQRNNPCDCNTTQRSMHYWRRLLAL